MNITEQITNKFVNLLCVTDGKKIYKINCSVMLSIIAYLNMAVPQAWRIGRLKNYC